MTEEKISNFAANVTIQHNIFVEKDLKKQCIGIMLEIIKSMAASGASSGTINSMLSTLERNAEIIEKALTQEK